MFEADVAFDIVEHIILLPFIHILCTKSVIATKYRFLHARIIEN